MTEHDLTGEVIELEDHQGNIVIGVGNVRLKVSRKEVHKISNAKKGDVKVNLYYTPTTNIKNEIDLRGLNSEEAIEQVDKYLDDAFLTGWKEVTLIHGKGDGTLRKVLNRFLQSHPRVAAKRLGGWQEGDLGVTIVELK
jgi:DNA mismatch repair protein MutS2